MGWHAGLVESLPRARSSQLDLAPKASAPSSQRGATSSVPRLKKAQLTVSLTRQELTTNGQAGRLTVLKSLSSLMSGEEELYVIPQDGLKPAEQITRRQRHARYQPEWSADGKRIAFGDKDGKVHVVTLADRKMVEIADSPRGQIRGLLVAARTYLAFSMSVSGNGFSSVYIWNAADGKVTRVTEDMFNAYSPAWDPQGNYLYFLSDREFAPQIFPD